MSHIGTSFQDLDTQGPLPGGRQAVFGRDVIANTLGQFQTTQTSRSQNNGVVIATIQLGQTGLDIATQGTDVQVRVALSNLGLAAQTGSAYDGTSR